MRLSIGKAKSIRAPKLTAVPTHIFKLQIKKAKNGFVVTHHFSQEGIQSPRKFIFPTSSGLMKHVERMAAVMRNPSPKIRMGKPLG